LTILSVPAYNPPACSEGTLHEAILKWSSPGERRWRFGAARGSGRKPRPSAAPAGGVSTPALGRPWGLVRAHYEGPPSMAGRGWDEGERKLSGCDRAARLDQSQPGRTGPGTEIAAKWSAERRLPPIARREETFVRRLTGRCRSRSGVRSQGPRACRRSIPSLFGDGIRDLKEGLPRADSKNTGDVACLDAHSCLKIEHRDRFCASREPRSLFPSPLGGEGGERSEPGEGSVSLIRAQTPLPPSLGYRLRSGTLSRKGRGERGERHRLLLTTTSAI